MTAKSRKRKMTGILGVFNHFPPFIGFFTLVLSFLATGALSCDDSKPRCIKNERLERKKAPTAPPPIQLEHTSQVPKGTLTISEIRQKISEKGILRMAGVLLRDTKKSIECFKNQHKHGRSCPPPYHIFGDAPPFSPDQKPTILGDRILVRMVPEPKGLKKGALYVIHGYWCPDGVLARFCARKIHQVSKEGAKAFWEKKAKSYAQKAAKKRSRKLSRKKARNPDKQLPDKKPAEGKTNQSASKKVEGP